MDPRNLFDPLREDRRFPGGPRVPPGSIPPGARFDPFGPPDMGPRPGRGPPFGGGPPTNFFGPNPDHFRPPRDDYDDMFM